MFRPLLFCIIMSIYIIFINVNNYSIANNNNFSLEKDFNLFQTVFVDDTIKNSVVNENDSMYFYISDTILSQDTIYNEFDYQRLYDYHIIDSTTKIDTIKVTPKKSSTEYDFPIYYTSDEKGMTDFRNKKSYLFTNAKISYEEITLTADYMELDFSNNEVLAHGMFDSLGNVVGKPVFKEGEDVYQADTIRYNFKTKKGIIKNVTTEFDGSFLHGGKTKMHANRHVHMVDGKYTTCDNINCPHFYFQISKAIVIPNDKIVSKYANLVIADIPTPIGLPFGFFPNTKNGTSGVIIPTLGNEETRGYFLRDGGYYWLISDKADLTLLGDIFSKGSWSLGMRAKYKVRYKYSGHLNLKYNKNSFGYKGLPNYKTEELFEFVWVFNQDPKARPNSTFSADVNMSSTKYNKENLYDPGDFMATNKQSSISYSKNFPNTPFSLSLALRHNQNNKTGTINFTLPDLSFSMNRIYPLKSKVKVGESKWYEKVGVSYTMNLTNRIKTNEKSFFNIGFDSITNGISHTIPVTTSLKFLKYTTVTPSFTYTERWYVKSMNKHWVDTSSNVAIPGGYVESDYLAGITRAWDYKASISWMTQLYGTFNFKGNGKLKAIRHVLSPKLSVNYTPDFSKPKYKFYDDYYQIRYNNSTGQYDTVSYFYSRFEGLPYGGPPKGGSGILNLDLDNNLEMKLRNKSDTSSVDKKVKIFESFSFGTNYNIFADSLKWAPLSISGRTRISILDFSFRGMFDPYSYDVDKYGSFVRIDKLLFRDNSKNNKIARLTSAYLSVDFSLNPKAREKAKNTNAYRTQYGSPYPYADFSIPWNMRVSYAINYSKPFDKETITQAINISGDLNLTEKWKVSINTGYDIVRKELTYTTVDIYRDLHCWEASLHIRPFGNYKSYMFQINVKSSVLQDLKLNKRRSWYDNFYTK